MVLELHQTPLDPKGPPLSREWSWLFVFEASLNENTRSKVQPLSPFNHSGILNKAPETGKLEEVLYYI